MTLATRCAACGTAFRVVEDQLKVSDGWVRCGSCNGVFNAAENLFHLPQEARSSAVDGAIGASMGAEAGAPSVVELASADATSAAQEGSPEPEPAAEIETEPSPNEALEPQAEDAPELQPEPQHESALEAAPGPNAVAEPEVEARSRLEAPSAPAPEVELEAAHSEEVWQDPVEPDTENAQGSPAGEATATEEEPKDSTVHESMAREASQPTRDSGRDPSTSESTDTGFESTVAITGSSAFPTSGFGASQPHSGFRDSDAPPDSRIDAHLFRPRRRPATKTLSERDRPDFSDARFDSDLMAYEEEGAVGDAAAPEAPVADTTTPEPHPAPGFLREAERNARWQRPKVRIALALGAGALAIIGVLQMTHHFRDAAAVRWPGLRPMLAQWCGIAGCTIEPLRRIDAISVESTALAKAPGTEAFRLAVGLRNRGSVPIALPSIDLSLTDGAGRLVARKALAAAEFKPTSLLLQPGADVILQTLLSTRGLQVTGYTVEVFYP